MYAVEDVELYPGKATLVSTGLIAEIPAGYEIQVRPRSGLALKSNVTVWNGTGTVDAQYRGVIGVILMYIPSLDKVERCNFVNDGHDADDVPNIRRGIRAESYMVKKGDKIAQLVLAPVTTCYPVEVEEVNTDTGRGAGGFGSTGK